MMKQKVNMRWLMEGKISLNGGAAYALAVLIGTVSALLLLLILSLAASAVVYFSPLSEDVLAKVALFIDGAVMLGGGFMAAKSSGRRGLIMGAAVGLILLLLMLVCGGVAGPGSAGRICVGLLCAMAGGVLGVR